jgi:hypothetical protein
LLTVLHAVPEVTVGVFELAPFELAILSHEDHGAEGGGESSLLA